MLQSEPAQYLRQQPQPQQGLEPRAIAAGAAAEGAVSGSVAETASRSPYIVLGVLLCTYVAFLGFCTWDSHAPRMFSVTVDPSLGHELGLMLDEGEVSDALVVRQVKSGLLEDWNRRHPERRILAGDHIVQVNGLRGDSCLLEEELWKSQPLSLIVCAKESEV